MNLSTLPTQNYVGLLQEKCSKNKMSLPDYFEDSEDLPYKGFKCICKLQQWTTEGLGCSKKIAKQNSAIEMLKTLENENLLCKTNDTDITKISPISKLFEYCSKEKKEKPLFADKPNEDDLFVVTCTWNDFTSEGRGVSRKIAKEKAADLCAQHFNIHKHFENLKKEEERQKALKTPTQLLHEYCQSKKQNCAFGEKKIVLSSKKEVYVATCTVGELEVNSAQNSSKKLAKMEAVALMLKLLHDETPVASPSSVGSIKVKCNSENSDKDDEPLPKRMK